MSQSKELSDAQEHAELVRELFVKFAHNFEECACSDCLSNLLKAALALTFAMEEEQSVYAKETPKTYSKGADVIIIQT